jgi:glycosyltransferase involved in cell wall biosynthesis
VTMVRGKYESTISVVIAALNEEEGIGPTLEELQKVLTDSYFIVVDGNSVDRTVEIAKNLGADVSLQEGMGKGDAMFQGIRQLHRSTRYVVFTDADYTYPAEYIPKMVNVLDHFPNVGMVIGDRFSGSLNFDKSPVNIFYFGNRFIAAAQYLINGIRLNDPLSGLRVVRAELLNRWKPKSKGFDVEAELNSVVERSGYRIAEIPIEYRLRLGKKKLGLRHGLGILMRVFTESFVR